MYFLNNLKSFHNIITSCLLPFSSDYLAEYHAPLNTNMFFVLSKYHHLFFNTPTFLGQFRPSHVELGPDWEWSAVRNLRGATQRGPAANSRRRWGRIWHLSLASLHQAGGGEGGKVSSRTIHFYHEDQSLHALTIQLGTRRPCANYSIFPLRL